MKKLDVFFVIALIFAFICPSASAASGKLPADSKALQKMEGKYYYLAYNLHGDQRLGKVSSVNYQLDGGLIPWGTEVKILKVYRNFLMFADKDSGKKWKYEFHYNSRQNQGLEEHIKSVFIEDPEPIRRKVESLSELDRDGIYDGRVRPGMSRDGVLITMGYPPKFANKRELMGAREWLYWSSRFNRITVEFDRNGKVSRIAE
ncbi:MAG: outer membrane protein assembly factor BamE [Proteobacteria bacterium]|nr:outer membrane protein assembly factor BamE [Pseudomonadota bacterium]MBU1739157.1 outer membrane protein assembly factor BamE [Pseudomonadota bacterium]